MRMTVLPADNTMLAIDSIDKWYAYMHKILCKSSSQPASNREDLKRNNKRTHLAAAGPTRRTSTSCNVAKGGNDIDVSPTVAGHVFLPAELPNNGNS